MTYNYVKEVKLDLLKKQIEDSLITIALDGISLQGTALNIEFKASLSSEEEAVLIALVDNHDKNEVFSFDPQEITIKEAILNKPFFDKKINGKSLFTRIIGKQYSLNVGENVLNYVITFNECKISGIEFVGASELDTASLSIYLGETLLNQFGFDVNLSKEVYKYESNYDADLFLGLTIKINYNSLSAKTIGVNFILHEVKA